MYIGTQPFIGQNRKLDNIASSFNGTLTTFNLTVSTEPVVASTPYQLFLSLGGVLQEPGVDFTVSGNQVVFTTPPAFGLTFFGLIQGDSIIFNTPSDGSITASKFASTLLIPFGLGTASAPSITFTGDLNNGIYSPGADQLAVTTNGTERMRIDSSGRLGLGTSSPAVKLDLANIHGINNTVTRPFALRNYGQVSATGYGVGLSFYYPNGTTSDLGFEAAAIDSSYTSGGNFGNLIFSTNNNTGVAERMRIDSSGNLLVNTFGTSATSWHTIRKLVATDAGNIVLEVGHTSNGVLAVCAVTGGFGGGSATNAGVRVGRDGVTTRSINATGTINASGADYAEYMAKAGDFTIAKGDVCGVTADGLLTINYAAAVSFVVKSTDPSYVGNDTWGSESIIGPRPDNDDSEALEDWKAALELERQKVDRIAFAGQVPVNVTTATPGQYIIPIVTDDGGITGVAKDESDLTLTEYMRAVGKVIAIEDDGRARIIVKVA